MTTGAEFCASCLPGPYPSIASSESDVFHTTELDDSVAFEIATVTPSSVVDTDVARTRLFEKLSLLKVILELGGRRIRRVGWL